MSTEVDHRVTPSLHPENVMQIEGYDDDTAAYLAPTVTAFDEAYQAIAKIHDARAAAAKNPTWNEAQQVISTQDLADKLFARVAKGFDSVRGNLERSIASLEAQLSGPVESKAGASIAAEIRAHVRGLNTGERQAFLQKAIDDGDITSATAVLGAPSYLSGLDANMQKVLLRFYHERQSPEVAKRLKAMQGARDLIERNAGLVFGQMEKAVGMRPDKVKKLRDAKTASEQAFILKDVA